ncbi:MAG: ATP-binding protein [Pseudomonadota bacterium]|nr:ATP-binding protein [Pseudomonadota bacterium]
MNKPRLLNRRPTSIHRHLAGVGAFITGVVGGLFLLVLVGVSLQASRSQVFEQSDAVGRVLASNLIASVVFQDPVTAAELLGGLASVDDVVAADLILPDGTQFAAYRRSLPDEEAIQSLYLMNIAVPVRLEAEQLATLHIQVDLWPVYQQLIWIAGVALVLWLLGMLSAYALSRVFNASITDPLSDLADMMSEVTEREDYAQRFHYDAQNELGSLVDAFNEMLERIGDREQRLRKMILDLEEARDQAEAAVRSKSSFLANMSHEIRTPMNGVMGMIALLKQGEMSAQQKAYFETIERSADALLLIIDDILDFTKIEAGRLELSAAPFNIRESLSSIEALFAEPAAQKDLSLAVTVESSVPEKVAGDPGRIRQILLNLIGNAVKFTEEGDVAVAVGLTGSLASRYLRFTVTDTGPGIHPDDQSRIFGEFYQADVSLTRAHGGTGLGLAITKQLVELMAGKLGFESTWGQGARFWVELPLILIEDEDTGAREESSPEPIAAAKEAARLERLTNPKASASAPMTDATRYPLADDYDLSVLVAEDSEVNQFIMRELLAKWGIEISIAANGKEALEMFQSLAFDLILMDIQMPEMDGLEATRHIRTLQMEPEVCPDCVIVGLSAHAMSGDRERYMSEGMMDYLTKPVRTEELRAVLDNCLVRKRGAN